MEAKIKYIVGNKFNTFATNPGVLTVSSFLEMLDKIENQIDANEYILGQGITESQEKNIYTKIHTKNLMNKISVHFREYTKPESKITHKKKRKNVMITTPVQVSQNLYRSHLDIDDSCAEMSDHVTGHHLQGMVLIEAARQLMLAVSELYYLDFKRKGKMYFILNSIRTEFKGFMFPIKSTIEYEVLEHNKKDNGTLSSNVVVKFFQIGELKTEVYINFTAYDAIKMSSKEQGIALSTLREDVNKLKVLITEDIPKVS